MYVAQYRTIFKSLWVKYKYRIIDCVKGGARVIINIADDLIKLHRAGFLDSILTDKTTKGRILWATNAYLWRGEKYGAAKELREQLIMVDHGRVIQTRARKAFEEQSERTHNHAEVFTPSFICKIMNDKADEPWTDEVLSKRWKKYVDARRLEITCGEGPYLVSRYNASTGEMIPINDRIGILDRKLAVVSKYSENESEWIYWSFRALQATYGYEFQGDNLLIARVNVLADWEDWFEFNVHRKPVKREFKRAINIIVWNLWQMDGLTGKVPNIPDFMEEREISLFGEDEDNTNIKSQLDCRIYDWINECKSIEYRELAERRKGIMKFDFIIGNPPYQEETDSDSTRKPPIYNLFMDESYKIGKVVELITPARFLFDAGYTPKAWNEKMLQDNHFKVLFYEPASNKIFSNTDIKGGVIISLRNENMDFGSIGIFTKFTELNGILKKVKPQMTTSMEDIISPPLSFKLSKLMLQENPNTIGRLRSSAFTTLSDIFLDSLPNDNRNYIQFVGLLNTRRTRKFIRRDYIADSSGTLDKYTVLLAKANGSGKFGEALSATEIAEPGVGYSQTFIGIGKFDDISSARNVERYLKTKFCRAMLGVLKITQDCPGPKWKYVPTQDFTSNSDIDWTQSIHNIDQQLYKKYGLDEKEISFIESHVKEMA